MNIKEQFQKPMSKYDLFAVIRQVLFMSIIGGLLIGSLQLLIIFQFGLSLTWLMLFVLSLFTARRIKRSITDSHIIFSLLSVLAFILAYYLMNVVSNFGIYYLVSGTIAIDFSTLSLILNPSPYFEFLFPLNGYFFEVSNIIDVVFFIIGTYYAFQYSK